MVKGFGDPIIIHDTSNAFTRRSHFNSSASQWRNFTSPNLKDMYDKPSRESTNHLDSNDEEIDIKKMLKEIEYLGSSHMSWKERKAMENRNVVALGGKPPKKHRVPLSVAKVTMKKQKEREQNTLQEGMILGKFGRRGNDKNRVDKRKPEDRALKATEGHFRNGVLNVKHLMGGLSSSRNGVLNVKHLLGGPSSSRNDVKGKKKGNGKKGKKKKQKHR